ncbi:MAG: ATP-binding protein [Actinomycetota bacterium]
MSQNAASEGISSVAKQARVVGLRHFKTPTLEAVEKRRWQLFGFSSFGILALTGVVVFLSVDPTIGQQLTFVPIWILRVLFVGLAAGLGLYLVDKEARLRKLTRALVDERVLSAALSNRLKEVTLLSEVGKTINQLLDLDDVLGMILNSAVDLLEADEGSIMLMKPDLSELVVAQSVSRRPELVDGATVKIGDGVAGWVAKNREPLLISGRANRDFFPTLAQRDRPVSSALSVPLIGGDELYGVLNINDSDGSRDFSEYDLRALGLFAEHAAIAIRNARTFEAEKAMIGKLEEVDKMKTEFLATVSHELRSPLTSIIGCAKTIRRRPDLADKDREEFLVMIERQGERLLKMVEEILSASRIESGQSVSRRERIDLVELGRTVLKGFIVAFPEREFQLEGASAAELYSDPMAVEQVITNLVDNAVKYSTPGTPVHLQVFDADDHGGFSVRDEGPGIASEKLGSIFDRFRQLDQSDTRAAGGVGLGLYIVRKLIEERGGSISVESELGVGTSFRVIFPKRKA